MPVRDRFSVDFLIGGVWASLTCPKWPKVPGCLVPRTILRSISLVSFTMLPVSNFARRKCNSKLCAGKTSVDTWPKPPSKDHLARLWIRRCRRGRRKAMEAAEGRPLTRRSQLLQNSASPARVDHPLRDPNRRTHSPHFVSLGNHLW